MKLYGIPNCDTVKKARTFLAERGIGVEFHDFRKQGVSEALLAGWLAQVGWQRLLKKTGPTWARLPQETRDSVCDDASALALMLQHPNIIRRPVLEQDGRVLATGFDANDYESLCK